MTRSVLAVFAATAVAVTATGCDRGWEMYEQVRLGRPVPEDLPLSVVGSGAQGPDATPDPKRERKLGWHDVGVCPLPPSMGGHGVGVWVDREGRVLGKSYQATVFSNYGAAVVAAMRHVAEVRLPASVLAAPDGTGQAPEGKSEPTLRSLLSATVHQATHRPVWTANTWILRLCGANLYSSYSMASSMHHLEVSVAHLPLHEAAAIEGYDRTFNVVPGGSIRVRNLGDRRFQVDINLCRIYDPLGLAAYLYFGTKSPAELEKEYGRPGKPAALTEH